MMGPFVIERRWGEVEAALRAGSSFDAQGADLAGAVLRPTTLDALAPGGFAYAAGAALDPAWRTPEGAVLIAAQELRVVVRQDKASRLLFTARPRLLFARALAAIAVGELDDLRPRPDIVHARIDQRAEIDPSAVVGPGAVIFAPVRIGPGCRIGANAVLGGPGFGFERDEQGRWERFPQVGCLILEADVVVGEAAVLHRAALTQTRIGQGARLDALSYVAHTAEVGPGAMLMSGARVMGRARVGARAAIHPGATIASGKAVGDDAEIGANALVLHDIPAGARAWGAPARIASAGTAEGRNEEQGT